MELSADGRDSHVDHRGVHNAHKERAHEHRTDDELLTQARPGATDRSRQLFDLLPGQRAALVTLQVWHG